MTAIETPINILDEIERVKEGFFEICVNLWYVKRFRTFRIDDAEREMFVTLVFQKSRSQTLRALGLG